MRMTVAMNASGAEDAGRAHPSTVLEYEARRAEALSTEGLSIPPEWGDRPYRVVIEETALGGRWTLIVFATGESRLLLSNGPDIIGRPTDSDAAEKASDLVEAAGRLDEITGLFGGVAVRRASDDVRAVAEQKAALAGGENDQSPAPAERGLLDDDPVGPIAPFGRNRQPLRGERLGSARFIFEDGGGMGSAGILRPRGVHGDRHPHSASRTPVPWLPNGMASFELLHKDRLRPVNRSQQDEKKRGTNPIDSPRHFHSP